MVKINDIGQKIKGNIQQDKSPAGKRKDRFQKIIISLNVFQP